MIFYNLTKSILEEIWWDWNIKNPYKDHSLWKLFKNLLYTILSIMVTLFFIPIDILLSPLEIAAIIYYYFFDKDK